MADITPDLPEIHAQEAKVVGDENLEVREPTAEVHTDSVPAQVAGVPEAAPDQVKVHETFIATDTVITDTSDPLAVQIPDAGRGSLDLPIHNLANPTVEQVFADSAAEVEERDPEAPTPGDASQPNPAAHEDDSAAS